MYHNTLSRARFEDYEFTKYADGVMFKYHRSWACFIRRPMKIGNVQYWTLVTEMHGSWAPTDSGKTGSFQKFFTLENRFF